MEFLKLNISNFESDPKWTVQKGKSRQFLKWTVMPKWSMLKRKALSQTELSIEQNWMVQDDSGQSFTLTFIYKFYSFGPSSFCLFDRPLSFLYTLQFHRLWPPSSIRLDKPFFALCTANFRILGPSSFSRLDRPLWPKTVHFKLNPKGSGRLSQNLLMDFVRLIFLGVFGVL